MDRLEELMMCVRTWIADSDEDALLSFARGHVKLEAALETAERERDELQAEVARLRGAIASGAFCPPCPDCGKEGLPFCTSCRHLIPERPGR